MSYSAPPPYEQPGQPGQSGNTSKGGKPWLLISGGIIVLLSLVLCGIGGFMAVPQMQDIGEAEQITGSTTVTLEEGESTNAWVEEGSYATCSAIAPDGSSVPDASNGEQTVSWGNDSYERAFAIEAEQSGQYTISCSAPFVLGDGISTGGILVASGGGVLCCIGFLVLVIGLVLWLVRRK